MSESSHLVEAVEANFGSTASLAGIEQVKVHEMGATLFDGAVALVDLKGHPQANRAYAWYDANGEDVITVLGVPPINSAEAAVRAALMAP